MQYCMGSFYPWAQILNCENCKLYSYMHVLAKLYIYQYIL